MSTLVNIVGGYIVGALAIQWFCGNILMRIPVLDQFALSIRNFLCICLFIIIVIYSIWEHFHPAS